MPPPFDSKAHFVFNFVDLPYSTLGVGKGDNQRPFWEEEKRKHGEIKGTGQ